MTCDHERREIIKRARENHEAPDWKNAIVEQCRDCGAYLVDVKGRQFVHEGDGGRVGV